MAKKVRPTMLRAIIGDEASEKMGNYTESTGGGTPLKKGEKLKDHPEAKRVQQPRDENGQFTYNSVNYKTRKYDYHGKGDTVPPFLRGVNFSYFVKKKGEINYNGLIYLAGINMSAEEIIERLRTYSGEDGFGKKLNTELKGKRGRRSNITKQKIAEGKEGILDDRSLKNLGNLTKKEFINKLKNVWNKYKNKKTSKKVFKRIGEVKVDTKLAKNDPSKFAEKYKNDIDKIVKFVPSLTSDMVVELMSSGNFKTFSELKEALKDL